MKIKVLAITLGLVTAMSCTTAIAKADKKHTGDRWTILGLGNETCSRWTNAHTGKEPEMWKFALDGWYLGFLSAHSLDTGITFDGMPLETATEPMNIACNSAPTAKIADAAQFVVNQIDKKAKK